jgi:hypothetical protein
LTSDGLGTGRAWANPDDPFPLKAMERCQESAITGSFRQRFANVPAKRELMMNGSFVFFCSSQRL